MHFIVLSSIEVDMPLLYLFPGMLREPRATAPSPVRVHHCTITRKRPELEEAAVATATPGLDLVPSDISLRNLDFALAE